MDIIHSIKFRTALVFVGLVLVTHALLFAVGELFFYSGIIWALMPFLGLYGLVMGSNVVTVTKPCADFMCEPNMLGWVTIAISVLVPVAVFWYLAQFIIRHFWKGGIN